MPSVLVVDPYPLVRDGLAQLVRAHPDLELAASVPGAGDAVGVHADVAVVGVPAAAQRSTAAASTEHPVATLAARLPVLALLDDPAPDAAAIALRAGAQGVLHRAAEPAAVARVLLALALGAVVAGLDLAQHLVGAPDHAAFPHLTPRERDVLDHLARGATNGQIAHALGLSAKTVRNHMASLCTKLHVLDRAQAAIAAREAGLGSARHRGRPATLAR